MCHTSPPTICEGATPLLSNTFTACFMAPYLFSSSGRRVGVGRADLDRRVFLQAGLELTDDPHHRVGDPGIVRAHVALLLQVGEEVDDLRQRESLRRVVHVILPDKMRLPVPPLDGGKPVSHVGGESFAVGVLLLAEEEVQLIHAVNRAILRDFCSAHAREGREGSPRYGRSRC